MAAISPPLAGPAPYPVRVDAEPPRRLSRWLWLVKWLLVVPHVIVLVPLWIAFAALSVVAFFAILLTARYPRGIFAFNVGVLRWTWRVAYYSYGALATDEYPPFTFADVPSYPAHLDVEPPGRLSRGLVLVKWWLLALPHYLVIALFVGTGAQTAHVVSEHVTLRWPARAGLIGILVLVAAVVLLVRGSYPRGLYDLVLGLQRWVLRVAAYVALMTDVYPPFRLDTGGPDPGRAFAAPPPPPGARPVAAPGPGAATRTTGAPPAPASPGASGATAAAVGGVILLVLGTGSLFVGASAGLASAAFRDGPYVTSPAERVSTPGYAVQVGEVQVHAPDAAVAWIQQAVGDVRIRAEASGGESVFLGIARWDDAAHYLAGVQHTEVDENGATDVPGGAPATSPQDAGIWAAQAAGPGRQSVRVDVQAGDWVAVVMPTDGSGGMTARIDVGASVPWLGDAVAAAVVVGLGLIAAGAILVQRGGRPVPA